MNRIGVNVKVVDIRFYSLVTQKVGVFKGVLVILISVIDDL